MSQQYSISQVTALPDFRTTYINDLKKKDKLISGSDYEAVGGLLSDAEYAWKAYGPHFAIYNCKTGTKVAAWSFGLVVGDYTTKVVCVDELRQFSHKLPLLVIGLSCELSGGMICIFDIIGSRILRSIQINEQVTSLHVIDASFDMCPLPGPLRAFDGILSVGTASGNVLLLDICRQTYEEVYNASVLNHIRDEINSCNINVITLNDIYSIELHKQVAIKNDEHLSVHLNVTDEVVEHFILKGPKGENRLYVNKEEVIVSALHYCPQLGSLLVGFNFGAWQLWNLISLQLVYTSPVCEGNTPVSHFALQEPCDDPKAFCYVWVVYSNKDKYEIGFPIAVLYSLNYESKEWHEGYGTLYQDLGSCIVRFQVDLLLDDNAMARKNVQQGSCCLRLQAISKNTSRGSIQEHQEETLSLCSIVWTSWCLNSKLESKTYMILFDLNQWYKAQMPSLQRPKNCETYMSRMCLNELLQSTKPDRVLDIWINVDTLTQFFGSQKLEEHYHPSSLAFKLHVLKESDTVVFNNKGSQRALLAHLESMGPSALNQPTEYYSLCISLGLTPIFVDVTSASSSSLEHQREYLLNVALEQHLIGWLYKCVVGLSTGSHSAAGCTLHFLLCWGWKRAQTLKQNVDKLTITLFDYSGVRLDANAHDLLINCSRQLKNVHSLFELVNKKYLPFLINPDVVKQQCESLQMVSVHVEVLQWLLHVGFLPECPISSYPRADKYNRISVPYPVDELIKYYDDRRAQLQSLYSKHFISKEDSPLFIDNLIDLQCGGPLLQKQWENDGGSGIYPPTSLQALLRTYLIENVEIAIKHSVMFYVFLDLVMILNQNRYKSTITHLIKFPAVFQLSPSIIKIIQAFWQLDHGEFGCAMEQLIDPLISKVDLKMWHHRVVLKAFFIQEQYNFALLYLQIWQPPITEIDDICIVISLFVAKNMLDGALHFQRQYSCTEIEEKLLHHFYKECDKREVISSVLNFPFTKKEEEIFVKYLEDVKHPNLKHLQLSYYIQRSRYIDAFKLTAANNVTAAPTGNKGSSSKHGVGLQNSVLNIMRETMPEFTKSVMNHCWKNNSTRQWKKVPRPEPFSVFVHRTNVETKYKSTLIHASLVKAQETWTYPLSEKNTEKNITISTEVENIPFLNTPKAVPEQPRILTPLIFPKIINLDVDHDNGVSLPKKLKLSSRLSNRVLDTNEEVKVNAINYDSILDTPVIKRKIARKSPTATTENISSTHISQSILKVKSAMADNDGTPRVRFDDSSLQRKTSLGLMPRKPIPRTPKPNVHFDISRTPSESSFTSTSSNQSFKIIQETAVIHSSDEYHKPNLPETSKTSTSIEEDFYTPRASTSSNLESKDCSRTENMDIDEIEVSDESKLKTSVIKSRRSYRSETSFNDQDIDIIKLCDEIDGTLEESQFSGNMEKSFILQTPKSRKSYKDESEFNVYEDLSDEVSIDVKTNANIIVDKSMEKSTFLEMSSSIDESEFNVNEISANVASANKSSVPAEDSNVVEKSTFLLQRPRSRKSYKDEDFTSEVSINDLINEDIDANNSKSDTLPPIKVNILSELEDIEKTATNVNLDNKDIEDAVLAIRITNDNSISFRVGKENGDTEIESLERNKNNADLNTSATESVADYELYSIDKDMEENRKSEITSILEANESLCTAEAETESNPQKEEFVKHANFQTTKKHDMIHEQVEPVSEASLQVSEIESKINTQQNVVELDTSLSLEQGNGSKDQNREEIQLFVNTDDAYVARKHFVEDENDDECEIIEVPSSDEEVEEVTSRSESSNSQINITDEQDLYNDESFNSENIQNIAIQSIHFPDESNSELTSDESKCDSTVEITSSGSIDVKIKDVDHQSAQLEVILEEIMSDESSITSNATTESVQIISSTTKSEISLETKSQQLKTISEDIPKKGICNSTLKYQLSDELELPSSTVQTTNVQIYDNGKSEKSDETLVTTTKCQDILDISWKSIKDPIKPQEDHLLDSTSPLLNSDLFKDSIDFDAASITWMDNANFNNFNETDVLDHTIYTSESKNNKNVNDSPGPSTYDVFTPGKNKSTTPRRRSKRLLSLQATSTPDKNLRITRRSSSFDSFHNIDDNFDVSMPFSTSKTPVKRQNRSASVDVVQPSIRTRRSCSVEVEIKKVQPVKKTPKKSTSALNVTNIEEYTASRRLTRKQANILQKSLGKNIFLGETSLLVPNDESNSTSEIGDGIYSRTRKRAKSTDSLDLPKPEIQIIRPKLRRTRQNSGDSDSSDISIISQTRSLLETNKSPEIGKRRTRSISGRLDTSIQKEQKKMQSKLPLPKIIEDQIVVSDSDSDISIISQTRSLTETSSFPASRRRRLKSTHDQPEQPVRRSERNLASKSLLPKIEEEQAVKVNIQSKSNKTSTATKKKQK